jgi:hypothetical protein
MLKTLRPFFRVFCTTLVLTASAMLPQAGFAQGQSAPMPGVAIPADAKEGVLEVENGQMELNDKRYPVTAALQVRTVDNNHLVSIYSLSGKFKVRYRIDPAGTLHRIWILERLK